MPYGSDVVLPLGHVAKVQQSDCRAGYICPRRPFFQGMEYRKAVLTGQCRSKAFPDRLLDRQNIAKDPSE